MAEELQISDFDYQLPSELIAQSPAQKRDQARLMVVHRQTGLISHHTIGDLPNLLQPNDLLVLNNSRVIKARLYGMRAATGGKWEGLYLKQSAEGQWEMLSQTRGYLQNGEWIDVEPGPLKLQVVGRTAENHILATANIPGEPFTLLELSGHMPIPPYIRKGIDQELDQTRYQTTFAKVPGSVAAPTAGLHFTPELFSGLKQKGIEHTFVTLHVGAGTFLPVSEEAVRSKKLHEEYWEIAAETQTSIAKCKKQGRVVAVGTTSARTLETAFATSPPKANALRPLSGTTQLFIQPGYKFQMVDAMLTNFHLPQSSLLMLVSAFAGRELILQAYQQAVESKYRFFSYGDAMLIV